MTSSFLDENSGLENSSSFTISKRILEAHLERFEAVLTSQVGLKIAQKDIDGFFWRGFPRQVNNLAHVFADASECRRFVGETLRHERVMKCLGKYYTDQMLDLFETSCLVDQFVEQEEEEDEVEAGKKTRRKGEKNERESGQGRRRKDRAKEEEIELVKEERQRPKAFTATEELPFFVANALLICHGVPTRLTLENRRRFHLCLWYAISRLEKLQDQLSVELTSAKNTDVASENIITGKLLNGPPPQIIDASPFPKMKQISHALHQYESLLTIFEETQAVHTLFPFAMPSLSRDMIRPAAGGETVVCSISDPSAAAGMGQPRRVVGLLDRFCGGDTSKSALTPMFRLTQRVLQIEGWGPVNYVHV